MNRAELISRMNEVSTELLRENGYISFVDVLLRMGKLAKEDHEAWRLGTIRYLERVIRLNLSQLKYLLHTLKDNARKGGLRPSRTVYVSWGKGPRRPLRFSKSGNPGIEQAYATHFVTPRESVSAAAGERAIIVEPVEPEIKYGVPGTTAEAEAPMNRDLRDCCDP